MHLSSFPPTQFAERDSSAFSRSATTGGESSLFPSSDTTFPESVHVFLAIASFVPFMANPFIYVFSNKSYRKAYSQLVFRRRESSHIRFPSPSLNHRPGGTALLTLESRRRLMFKGRGSRDGDQASDKRMGRESVTVLI